MMIVTPFVGVWIETPTPWHLLSKNRVTPFVGVWIETLTGRLTMRLDLVTPFVGVWIETWWRNNKSCIYKSHPSWVCGLKHK